jgi:UDP-N-acetylmuramoyl-L-alanyl-D-glutamate--2,6-diaminopimelate ligase
MCLVGQTPSGAFVYIDYAHAPGALSEVLKSLKRMHPRGKLGIVFGCGGERDSGKRPIMGTIAVQEADWVVVTDDNPRYESGNLIIQDIIRDIPQHQLKSVTICPHREKAIHLSLERLQSQDVLLIAGKGHEKYQIIQGINYLWSDTACIQTWIQKHQ